MNKEKDYEDVDSPRINFIIYLIKVSICFGLLYLCGWDIIWDASLYSSKDFILGSKIIAISFNDLYYGLEVVYRFFDSVVISWITFFIVLGLITPFRFFFFSSN